MGLVLQAVLQLEVLNLSLAASSRTVLQFEKGWVRKRHCSRSLNNPTYPARKVR